MDSLRRDLLKLTPLAVASFAPLAWASPRQAAPQAGAGVGVPHPLFFDVRSFGAAGTGKQLDTSAVNAAIEAAAGAGGGTVYFPAGTYLCFSIRLKSYVDLYLAQGATILAAASPLPGQTTGEMGGTYDAAEPQDSAIESFQDYGHNHWHNSLLWGENLHDFGIFGPGLIYGKGLSFGAGPGRPVDGGKSFTYPEDRLFHRPTRGDYPMYQAEQAGVGNKAIALKNCRNVLLRDFSILKGGHFGLLLTGVDNLTIDNLKIDTDRDGMDIDCCKNVHVNNCTVNSPWDDGICPKSSYALGYLKPTENVTIANCIVTGFYELGTVLDGSYKRFAPEAKGVGRTGRIKCGTESNGGFRNITIANCVLEGCNGLALESEDGALCEDIAFTNITCRDLINGPLFFRLGSRLRGPAGTTKVGTLKRIAVSNIVSSNQSGRLPNILSGIPGYPIEDIKISDFYAQHTGSGRMPSSPVPELENKYPDPGMFGDIPAHGFYLRHVHHLEMSHVEIAPLAPDSRAAFYLDEVERADFFAISAPKPAFSLHAVKDMRVLWSRAVEDVTLASADGQTL
jgi:polygalacturonase